jgi:hypothetical protein
LSALNWAGALAGRLEHVLEVVRGSARGSFQLGEDFGRWGHADSGGLSPLTQGGPPRAVEVWLEPPVGEDVGRAAPVVSTHNGGDQVVATRSRSASPAVPLPAGFPHPSVVAPWWTVEMGASPDSHTNEAHVHLDHVYVALWAGEIRPPETMVRSFDEPRLTTATDVASDSRMQGLALFDRLDEILAAG